MTRWLAVFTMLMLVVAVACSGSAGDDNTQTCGGMIPGVIVQAPGIQLAVRDPFGVAQANGTSAVVRDAQGAQVYSVVVDTLNIDAAFNVAGTYSVTLTRPDYRDATVTSVIVTPERCAVHTTKVPVTMEVAPG